MTKIQFNQGTRYRRLSFIILAFLFCVVIPAIHAADSERIVIINSRIVGGDDPERDVTVNIIIVNNTLEVMTKDSVIVQEGDVALDANGGFLMGTLVMGTRPSFVVLDQDPRENADVLLDTRTYNRLAISEGVITWNELPEVPPSPPDANPRPRRWRAYTPPPLAVPIRYNDVRKWNKFETKPISGLFTGALMLDRQFWVSQDGNSESQVGDLSAYDAGEIRAFRFGVVGTFNFENPWRYTVFASTNTFDKGYGVDTTNKFGFNDYRLDIPLPASLMISIGKQKEPISMERLMALSFMPMQERSAVADALLPARNHGIVLSGIFARDRLTWAVGGFNNWIDSDFSFADTPSQFVARVTGVPALSPDESNLLHLGFGVRYSNAKQPIRAATEPEFNQAPIYVDTGDLAADYVMTYSAEAYWRWKSFLTGFEYLGAVVNLTGAEDSLLDGYHLTLSWTVTGETRPYRKRSGVFDPIPVARTVTQGGWGALEVAFRYSRLDLNDKTVSGGDMNILSIGTNWWPTRKSQFSVNYRYIFLDRSNLLGQSSGLDFRLTLMLD